MATTTTAATQAAQFNQRALGESGRAGLVFRVASIILQLVRTIRHDHAVAYHETGHAAAASDLHRHGCGLSKLVKIPLNHDLGDSAVASAP